MAHIEVPHPGASEIVGRLLSEALSEHPDVQWLGLVSEDGFAIASEGEATLDDDAVAAGAVRMMIQVRAMAKALGQEGTSQLFMEGSESGICVIDKDPWVLVMVGAPGVPIGLLRYEAREISDAFPMTRRAELTAGPADAGTDEEQPQWWSVPEPVVEQPVDDVVEEIRWADEPISDDPSGIAEEAPATDFVVVDPDEDLSVAEPAAEEHDEPVSFDLAPPMTQEDTDPISFEMTSPVVEEDISFDLAQPAVDEEVSFDLAPPVVDDEVSFDLAPPIADEEPPAMPAGFAVEEDLLDLDAMPAPMGPSIDLPPPAGPAFQLPPPV
jgi:predicted regulator of Ras-like GTPase activity (Roadblock/LC7/MglB family)